MTRVDDTGRRLQVLPRRMAECQDGPVYGVLPQPSERLSLDGPRADEAAIAAGAAHAAVTRRIQAVDRDDPMRQRKVLRIFVESVLSAAFGQHLLNDPAFAGCVDAVQRRMEADPELSMAMSEAAMLLIARHGASATPAP